MAPVEKHVRPAMPADREAYGQRLGQCVARCYNLSLEQLEEEQQSLKLTSAPDSFVCPISGSAMVDPVITADGHLYDRESIINWFLQRHKTRKTSTSPCTGLELSTNFLMPIVTIQNAIERYLFLKPEIKHEIKHSRVMAHSLRLAVDKLEAEAIAKQAVYEQTASELEQTAGELDKTSEELVQTVEELRREKVALSSLKEEVQRLEEEVQRWEAAELKTQSAADSSQAPHWLCLMCSEPNRTDREQCNNCGGSKPAEEVIFRMDVSPEPELDELVECQARCASTEMELERTKLQLDEAREGLQMASSSIWQIRLISYAATLCCAWSWEDNHGYQGMAFLQRVFHGVASLLEQVFWTGSHGARCRFVTCALVVFFCCLPRAGIASLRLVLWLELLYCRRYVTTNASQSCPRSFWWRPMITFAACFAVLYCIVLALIFATGRDRKLIWFNVIVFSLLFAIARIVWGVLRYFRNRCLAWRRWRKGFEEEAEATTCEDPEVPACEVPSSEAPASEVPSPNAPDFNPDFYAPREPLASEMPSEAASPAAEHSKALPDLDKLSEKSEGKRNEDNKLLKALTKNYVEDKMVEEKQSEEKKNLPKDDSEGEMCTWLASALLGYGSPKSPLNPDGEVKDFFVRNLIDSLKDKKRQQKPPTQADSVAEAEVYKAEGDREFIAGEFNKALTAYTSAAKCLQDFAPTLLDSATKTLLVTMYCNMTYICSKLGDDHPMRHDDKSMASDLYWASAVTFADKAIALDPVNPKAFFRRGLAHGRLREFQKGIDDISITLRLEPKNVAAHRELLNIQDGLDKQQQKLLDLYSSGKIHKIRQVFKELKENPVTEAEKAEVDTSTNDILNASLAEFAASPVARSVQRLTVKGKSEDSQGIQEFLGSSDASASTTAQK